MPELFARGCPHLGWFVRLGHDGGGHKGGGCHKLTSGATQDIAQRGVCREWPRECHAIDWFCRNVVGPPEWEHEAISSVVWVQCTNLCRVYNLSIAASSVMDTIRTRSHYLVCVDMEDKLDIINLLKKVLQSKCGDLDYEIVVRSHGVVSDMITR